MGETSIKSKRLMLLLMLVKQKHPPQPNQLKQRHPFQLNPTKQPRPLQSNPIKIVLINVRKHCPEKIVLKGTLHGNGRHGVERCHAKAVEWWWWTKAAALSDLNAVKTLLADDVNAHFQTEKGWTPLRAACENGRVKIVKVLLTRKLIQIRVRCMCTTLRIIIIF